jgi:hypothetical protein
MDWKRMLANYPIERQIEALIEAGEVATIEDYERYQFDDDFRRAAEATVAEAAKGTLQTYAIVVVLYEADGVLWDRWRYRTFQKPPGFTGEGCVHEVRAAGARMARVDALTMHRQGIGCLRGGVR